MKSISFILIAAILSACSGPSELEIREATLKRAQQNEKMLKENSNYLPLVEAPDFNFYGLEAIYVEIGRPYYSWIGHVFIRLVGSGKTPLEDLGISFLPMFDTPITENLRAYYGGDKNKPGYPIFPVVKTWKEFLSDYVQKENRYVDRYVIKSTPELRKNFHKVLLSWMRDYKNIGEFSFKRGNCTYWQLELMKKSGFQVDPKVVVFPINFIYYLKEQNLLSFTYPRITKENMLQSWDQMQDRSTY